MDLTEVSGEQIRGTVKPGSGSEPASSAVTRPEALARPPVGTPTPATGGESAGRLFRRGFVAMLPLWTGAIPFGIAYAVAARNAGLTPVETQVMSLVVFSAAAQVGAVSLLAAGAPAVLVVATVLLFNAQLPLFGVAISRATSPVALARAAVAWLLTDAAFAVASALGPLRVPVLLGAGACMYAGWNLGTALGILGGQLLPDTHRVGLDLVVPLTFLAVLVPLIRTHSALAVALLSGAAAVLLARALPAGLPVLAAAAVGMAAGAWLTRPRRPTGRVA